MRIRSNFEDYYDSCTYMCGEDVYYERILNLATLTSNKEKYAEKYYILSPLLKILEYVFTKYTHYSICIIGELIIPFKVIVLKGDLRKKSHIYSSDKYDYTFEFIFESNKDMNKFEKEHFTKSYIDLYNAIRKVCKEPIISYSPYEDMYSELPSHKQLHSGVNINPVLKRLGFSKQIPAYTVIQELELYLNKLKNVETTVIFSDKLKIASKGFDKNSFRKTK